MATVPIQDTNPRDQYVAVTGQTTFPYTFWVSSAEDIGVYINGTLRTLNDDYSVTGVQDVVGGNVIFVQGLAEGDVVTLSRQMPFARITEFQTGGTFKAEVLNFELSKMIAMMQQLQRDVYRSIKLPATSGANPQLLFLPDPELGRALVWGENTLENGPNTADIATAGANAQTAVEASNTAVAASLVAQAAAGGVRISNNDEMAQLLESKLLAGNGLVATTQNEGANETRTFAVSGKTPFAMAGYRSDGSFNEVFLGDGLLRDNSTLAIDKATLADVKGGVSSSKVMTPAAVREVLLLSGSVTDGASIDMEPAFNDAEFQGGYDIEIDFKVGTTNARPDVLVKVGGSYATSDYVYESRGGNSAAVVDARAVGASSIRPCNTGTNQGIDNSETAKNHLRLHLPAVAQSTTEHKQIMGRLDFKLTSVGNAAYQVFSGMYKGSAEALQGVRFAPSAGTVSGTFRVIGRRW